MSLTKKQRQLVWDKSGGKCWYCGSVLPERGWHADHVDAVIREGRLIKLENGSHKYAATGGMHRAKNHTIDNIVPACAPCNLFKSTHNIEFFREEIAAQIERARASSVNFRVAERFGLIEIKVEPVVFWFEKNLPPAESRNK